MASNPNAGLWELVLGPHTELSHIITGTAGFRVDYQATEPFAQTMICTPVEIPFEHRLPGETEARALGEAISEAGIAKPA